MSLQTLEELLAEIQQRRVSALAQLEQLGEVADTLGQGLSDPEIRATLEKNPDEMVANARAVLKAFKKWTELPTHQLGELTVMGKLIGDVFTARVIEELQAIGAECLGGYG